MKSDRSTFANRVRSQINVTMILGLGAIILFVLRIHINFELEQKTSNFKIAGLRREMQWGPFPEDTRIINLLNGNGESNREGRGAVTLGLSSWRYQHERSGDKAPKRRIRFSPSQKCRARQQRGRQRQPARTRMRMVKSAARFMQLSRCGATNLKTDQRLLQQASNIQRSHALARNAQQERRCSSTCTLLTRPRVTRSIIHPAHRPVVLHVTCMPTCARDSPRQEAATHPNMAHTGARGENSECT
jgi:hypothetical protein